MLERLAHLETVMDSASIPLVLIVANKTAATPALLAAVRSRAEQGPATFHLLVPNPKTGAWRPSSIHHPDLTEGELVLALALPLLSDAAGTLVDGTTSNRHDPLDAVEETVNAYSVDEIILSTLPHHVSAWLHVDLPHQLAHLGLPVTTIFAQSSVPAT